MKLAVLIKQVHAQGITRIAPDEADLPGDFRINGLDEHALEEGLRIKESRPDIHLTLISVGPPRVTEALRRGLGMGADAAIHIHTQNEPHWAMETAGALCPCLKELAPDLILCGAMSEDLMQGMTGPALAALLGIPVATQVVEELAMASTLGSIDATRDAGGGTRQTVRIPLPCLVSIQRGFNTPRYPNISSMLRARSHPIAARKPPKGQASPRITGASSPVRRGRGKRIKGSPEELARDFVDWLTRQRVLADKEVRT